MFEIFKVSLKDVLAKQYVWLTKRSKTLFIFGERKKWHR